MDIKVLGTGCAIMGYGVMSTPGVVVDGNVVHAGGVPGRDKIEQRLAAGSAA